MTYLLAEATHLSISACVVGDRTVGIRGERDAECGEHTHRGDTDAVESVADAGRAHAQVKAVGTEIAQHDSHRDGEHGHAGRDHPRAYALDDHRGGTRLTGLGDALCRLIALRGIVFRGLSDDHSRGETADH